jgi:hypothetical protein
MAENTDFETKQRWWRGLHLLSKRVRYQDGDGRIIGRVMEVDRWGMVKIDNLDHRVEPERLVPVKIEREIEE